MPIGSVFGAFFSLYIPHHNHIQNILLAPGGISHSGPGGNRQLWPDKNSQS